MVSFLWEFDRTHQWTYLDQVLQIFLITVSFSLLVICLFRFFFYFLFLHFCEIMCFHGFLHFSYVPHLDIRVICSNLLSSFVFLRSLLQYFPFYLIHFFFYFLFLVSLAKDLSILLFLLMSQFLFPLFSWFLCHLFLF